eukprot:GABV01006156.1.p1 GENE.GABV01006156.1~~GABV01006156.1.p1  ORF type:complete len:102 (-),score=43.03 GABV01006156.1:7-312(-)
MCVWTSKRRVIKKFQIFFKDLEKNNVISTKDVGGTPLLFSIDRQHVDYEEFEVNQKELDERIRIDSREQALRGRVASDELPPGLIISKLYRPPKKLIPMFH